MCAASIEEVGSDEVVTIEAAHTLAVGQRVQLAWINTDVVQCGYCQPGQIMRAIALLQKNPNPSDADIRDGMAPNICRCGCYPRIHAAVRVAAETAQ